MNIETIHEPPFEPVTLAEAKLQLRIESDVTTEDARVTRLITTARRDVEQQTRRSLIRQTLRLSMDDFPTDVHPVRRVRLFRPPVITVLSVKYYDSDNTLQTVDAASYYWTDQQVPELRFVTDYSAPTVYDRPDALQATYVTGYLGDGSPPASQAEFAEHVPSELKDAILVGVQLLHTPMSSQDMDAMKRLQRSLLHPLIVMLT